MKPANLIRETVAYQTLKAKNIAKNAYAKSRKNQKLVMFRLEIQEMIIAMTMQIMKPANLIRATVAYQTVKAKDIAKNAYAKSRKNQKLVMYHFEFQETIFAMTELIQKHVNLIRETVAYQTVKAKDTAKTACAKQKIQNTLEKTVVEDQVKEILKSHSPVDHLFLLQR